MARTYRYDPDSVSPAFSKGKKVKRSTQSWERIPKRTMDIRDDDDYDNQDRYLDGDYYR